MANHGNAIQRPLDEIDEPTIWEPSPTFLIACMSAVLIGAFCYVLALGTLGQLQTPRFIGPALFALLAIVSWVFLSFGKVKISANLLAFGAWTAVTGLSVFYGGVRTPVIAAYPLIIVAVGWLIGTRAAFVMTALSVATTAGLMLAEYLNVLPKPILSLPVMYGVVQLIVISLSSILITFIVRIYHKRLMELRRASADIAQRTMHLEKNRADLQRAQNVANVGSWRYDIAADMMSLSPETCRIFGFPDETKGSYDSYITRVAKSDTQQLEQAWQLGLKSGVFDHEHRIEVGKNVRWIRQKAEFEYAADGSVLSAIGITQDITERKSNEAELIAAKAAADTANSAKSHFLAAASHDLRQPLTALSLYVSVLKNTSAPEGAALINNIEACMNSLSVLLTDLLDVSKLDAGVVTPVLSDFSIDDMLSALITIHSAEANIKGLRLSMRRSNVIVRSDQQLLQRILGNLIVNALHFTKTGGVLLACRHHAGKRWIEVWDSGIGIPAEATDLIFEEFRQLGDDSRSSGSGLGLAIVAKTAKLLGAEIRLRSRTGHGSMFAIEITTGRAADSAAHIIDQRLTRPLRIGLVEDNEKLQQALCYALENAGHEVIGAADGVALLEKLGPNAPDVLISDYRLADAQTGFDVIAMVRQLFGDEIPAVIVTGDTNPSLIRSMADRGIAVHYKPLQIEVLETFFKESLERRKH